MRGVSAPTPTSAVVVGRYGGTVGVLAGILRGEGVDVTGTAALDTGGRADIDRVLAASAASVVVVTLVPGDAALDMVLSAVPPDQVVAVTWHPADERPGLPVQVRVVAAGRIHADLTAAVRAQS